jgi:hypothetical protein
VNNLLVLYERLLAPHAVHGPNYNPFVNRNDGVAHGILRVVLQMQWVVYAAGITGILIQMGLPAVISGAIAVFLLLDLKIRDVLVGIYHFDPLDWCCDIGGWAVTGALIAVRVLGHHPVPIVAWCVPAALWLVTFPWATP